MLLTNELVANAVLHARSAIDVILRLTNTTLRVEVRDRNRAAPVTRLYGPEATTGRGLLVLDRLARRWGVDGHPDGKAVWFELECAGEG